MAESEELKSLLMKVKEENAKAGLKLNIKNTKIMASSPITSWQIDGETMGTVTDFIFLGSKITADGDCSHEIKRRLSSLVAQRLKRLPPMQETRVRSLGREDPGSGRSPREGNGNLLQYSCLENPMDGEA